MSPEIEITPFTEGHLLDMWRLWKAQYTKELSVSEALPASWSLKGEEIRAFLRKSAASKYFVVAKIGGRVVGHMLFQVFPFHGETTAFCPITGHAERVGMRGEVLEALYTRLSERLVADGVRSHCITFFAHDDVIEKTAFQLGFGMIVIDAFRGAGAIGTVQGSRKRQATMADLETVRALGEESCGYYRSAPIFLVRKKEQADEYYARYLGNPDRALFLAFSGSQAVGFMSVCRGEGLNYYDLSDTETALIDEMGAYIKPGHRGRGLGKALLAECIGWCQRSQIQRIHVDFESANLAARSFWLRHFAETARSVRRAVYKDIAHGVGN